MIKKITTLLFALVFIYSYLLYYAVFYVQLSSIKTKVNDNRQSDYYQGANLKTLSFSKKDLNATLSLTWIEENEFIYNNQLYDVYDRSVDNDSIRFQCQVDDDENELFFELEKHVNIFINKNTSTGKKGVKHKIFIKDFICQPLAVNDFSSRNNINYHREIFLFKLSWHLVVESPPPIYHATCVYTC